MSPGSTEPHKAISDIRTIPMRPLLSRPYPLQRSARSHVRSAILFGLFVFVFLYVFRPFGLHFMEGVLFRVALGYGAVCTAVMLVINVVLSRLLEGWFREDAWTVGRELLWTTFNVASIGLANGLYTVAIGLAPLTLLTIAVFTGYTVVIGSFPLIVSILLNEVRLNRIYALRSEGINANLPEAVASSTGDVTDPALGLRIPAEQAKDDLLLSIDALYIIRSADNYVEVFHQAGRSIERTVMRGSLKSIEEYLAWNDRFLRCHKRHLVDLRKVLRVSGNAQGLKLHLEGFEEPVPVSRQLTSEVRRRLALAP